MESLLSGHAPAFQKALDNFRSNVAQSDQDEFKYTTLEDLQRSILEIQEKHASGRKAKNMARLNPFLKAMEQYGKVIEVFLNTSEFVAFVWVCECLPNKRILADLKPLEGPTKFLLQVASTFVEAFDELLDAYNDIGESLPMLAQYESLFQEKRYMGEVLELIYVDILKFHQEAYKYFKQRVWKQLFQITWKSFRFRFKPVLEDLRRHKDLVEKQASLYQYEEVQRVRITAETEFRSLREAEDLRQRWAVQDFLSAANVEEDQEIKASVRAKYPGVCSWILNHKSVQAWSDPNLHSSPLLWIKGIPGSGKTTLASFLVEQLRKTPSNHVVFFYCKHEDKDRNSFVALARAMIGQIVLQNDSLVPYVYEKAATCGEKPLKTLKRSQDILEIALKSLDRVCIIIDGLDECPPSEKETIASWFQTLIRSMSEDDYADMKCIFLCQSDKETSKLFKGLPSVLMGSADLAGDIETFCKIEGEKIKNKFALLDPEKDEIIQKVSHEAKDMFLYAKLVMKNLLDQTRLANLRKEMQPGRFPKGINQAYGRIVDRILDKESTEREGAEQLLGLLACAKRPLKWTEIQGAISIDLGAKIVDFDGRCFRADSKDLCGSLVEIRPGGTVELVHMTAKHYLIYQGYISLKKEEFSFARLCLEYLSMRCFNSGLAEHVIQEFIETGHYAFAEYAITYWSEHLLGAIRTLEALDLESLAHFIDVFLNTHFSPAPSTQPIPELIEKNIERFRPHTFYDNLGQAIVVLEDRKRSNPKAKDPINNLDLEDVLCRIRSLMEKMSSSEKTKHNLERIHGVNIFKCSRIDCTSFFEGFSNLDDCRQHQRRHDRRFHCTFEGCVAVQSGFASSIGLQRHFERFHDPSSVTGFPCYREPSKDDVKRAIKEANIPVIEQFLQNENPKGHMLEFEPYRTTTKSLWQTAINYPDDEVIGLLIRHTKFQGTRALSSILRLATAAGQTDLVHRFIGDESCHQSRESMAWEAIDVAISHNNVDILRILINNDLLKTSSANLTEAQYRLSRACVSGSLSCVQYFVSECALDPFQHTNSQLSLHIEAQNGIARRTQLSKELRTHSPLYNAIAAGHRSVVKYLLNLEDIQRLSKPEEGGTLLTTAATNGHEEIVEMLTNHKDIISKFLEQNYLIKAKLYNAVRSGKEGLVKELLPQAGPDYDMPDRNGCSMLMYAALNGLEYTVEYLLQKGANVGKIGNCPEATASTSPDQSALILAVFNGHTRVVRRLLQCPGIQVGGYIVPRKGQKKAGRYQNSFQVAELKGHGSISQLLRNHEHDTRIAGMPSQTQHQPSTSTNIGLIEEPPALDRDEPGNSSDGELPVMPESDDGGTRPEISGERWKEYSGEEPPALGRDELDNSSDKELPVMPESDDGGTKSEVSEEEWWEEYHRG
ncbi:hypothetical protein GP486_002248 [Trichoglossum hirsutum]|uniref:NACHT domain-containing protein n=1 Tax=Trichoglossum hirsutum TaxID=265104 RepID=A0A9P8RRW1_9PEZI|nr:hypothetical protein GP486_002248 [Trichoglossum hirsutum]